MTAQANRRAYKAETRKLQLVAERKRAKQKAWRIQDAIDRLMPPSIYMGFGTWCGACRKVLPNRIYGPFWECPCGLPGRTTISTR